MVMARGSALSQVWLTYVLTDLDVPKALTLCFSLKKVFTSRKLAVLVSPNVSPAMRELVRHAFDFLFSLEEGLNTAGLTNEEFVKVSAFTLKCFGKVAFLEPTVFAVKNSDDIFDNYQVSSGVLPTEAGQDDIRYIDDDLSIFVAKPCLQVFQALMNSLKTKTKNGTGVDLKSRFLVTTKLTFNQVEMKYSGKLSETRTAFLRNESDVSLVNIDIPLEKVVTGNFGFCGKVNTT
ncbi:unnamed protein product [Orchesella dallaii]|uniref:Uncharacterized protein n=1 Tax=Orchesella dallaii TaxID=48710 RepID=A0ABP1S8Y9_9HEXA